MGAIFCDKPRRKTTSSMYYFKSLSNDARLEDQSSPKAKILLKFSFRATESSISSYNLKVMISQSKEEFISIFEDQSKIISSEYKQYEPIAPTHVFCKSAFIDYYFEKSQNLKICFFRDGAIDDLRLTVGKVMGSKNQLLLLNTKFGELYVKGISLSSEVGNEKKVFKFGCRLKLSIISKEPIYYSLSSQGNLLYSSESSPAINKHVSFKDSTFPFELFTQGLNSIIDIEVFNDFNEKLGHFSQNLEYLTMYDRNTDPKLSSKLDAKLALDVPSIDAFYKGSIDVEYQFLDYLRAGMQISLMIGIDFTASNGEPYKPNSLHYFKDNLGSPYEQAIRACGDIVAYYDYDQLFPVFGYGALVGGSTNVNHCFPINFQPDPNINGIDSIISSYRDCVRKITLYGPTNFAPILSQCLKIIRYETNKRVYFILMIITDGAICDLQPTVDQLVLGSELPLSIIIIGVGDGDFTSMDFLDADVTPLTDSRGNKSKRDLVQFVPFNKYARNIEKLAEEVLAEIPLQVVEYYKQKGISPSSL